MDIEQAYMRRIAEMQYPGDVDSLAQGEDQGLEQAAMQATVGTLPQPAMPADGQGSIREIPRNPFQQAIGKLGELIQSGAEKIDFDVIGLPGVGSLTLKDLTVGDLGKVLQDMSYGFMPVRGAGGIGGTAGLKPEATELLNLPIVGQAAKLGVKGAVAAGKAGAKFVAPKVGEMLDQYMRRTGMTMDLMAYHGSPARFEKFDTSKIGSGEGAQAYGYGFYFAESPDVANTYRVNLSYDPEKIKIGNRQINQVYETIQNNAAKLSPDKASTEYEKLQLLESLMMNNRLSDVQQEAKTMSAATKTWFDKTVVPNFETYGSFYTVDIPDEIIGKMLDWDKPLGQQSKAIKDLAIQAGLEMDDLGGDLVARLNAKRPEGAALLREKGITGIRYLDAASRGNSDKSRNIVVFPGGEDKIKILKVE